MLKCGLNENAPTVLHSVLPAGVTSTHVYATTPGYCLRKVSTSAGLSSLGAAPSTSFNPMRLTLKLSRSSCGCIRAYGRYRHACVAESLRQHQGTRLILAPKLSIAACVLLALIDACIC